jgi:hypothetical protein
VGETAPAAIEPPGAASVEKPAQAALESARAAVEATGARAELPFIERAREKLLPASA